MDEVDALFEQVVNEEELQTELGRERAYRRCCKYAQQFLYRERICNLFLVRAAERLGQQPQALDVIYNRVLVPDDALLCSYLSDEEELVTVGNPAGLRYLAALCLELADAAVRPETVRLEPEEHPLIGDSYPLELFCERDDWFEDPEDEMPAAWRDGELHGRILNEDEVVAVQFMARVRDLAVNVQKLYRVEAIEPLAEQEVVRKPYRPSDERVVVVTLTDDDGETRRLAVDLEDPDVTFYYAWHLEQFAPESE